MLAAPPGLDHQQHTVGEEEEQEKEEEEGTLRFFNNTAGPQVLLQVCETKPEASTAAYSLGNCASFTTVRAITSRISLHSTRYLSESMHRHIPRRLCARARARVFKHVYTRVGYFRIHVAARGGD